MKLISYINRPIFISFREYLSCSLVLPIKPLSLYLEWDEKTFLLSVETGPQICGLLQMAYVDRRQWAKGWLDRSIYRIGQFVPSEPLTPHDFAFRPPIEMNPDYSFLSTFCNEEYLTLPLRQALPEFDEAVQSLPCPSNADRRKAPREELPPRFRPILK